ncbi:MAG: DUF6174 domain-containing protein [Chloroflexota bacterium]
MFVVDVCRLLFLKVDAIVQAKRIISTVGILLLIGILIQVLFDPISSAKHAWELSRVRAEYPQSRAKWDAHRITNYRLEVNAFEPFVCQPHAVIEVRDENVVKVEVVSGAGLQLLPPYEWADPDWGNEVFLCDYANFTMTQIFDLVDRALHNDPSIILQADFDPEYGFITSYRYGLFVGKGLLSPRVSECCGGFSISSFEPLQP